jgi:hypothetical protein
VACNLKLFKGMEIAVKQCEQSIIILKSLNSDSTSEVGIASQNLIEELLDNLLLLKDKELDVIDEEEGPETLSTSPQVKAMNITSSSKADPQHMQYLQQISKGNKITQSKEFKLVFFITCFVPFIRPNVPMIKSAELNTLK